MSSDEQTDHRQEMPEGDIRAINHLKEAVSQGRDWYIALLEAIKLTEKSELVKKALGEELFNFFIRNKKMEWDEYKAQVTEYETKKYLPIL